MTIGFCKDCQYRDVKGYCQNKKIDEDVGYCDEKVMSDMLIYDYNEGGSFWVGSHFGCIHFMPIIREN